MNKREDSAAAARMPTAAELLAATGGDAPTAVHPAANGAAARARGGRSGRGQGGHDDQAQGGGLAALGAAVGLTEAPDARALREAADAEPGVRSRSCLIRTDDATGETTVTISVAIAYGLALHAVAERVRERVAAAAVDVLGVAPPATKRTGAKATKKTAAAAKSQAAGAKKTTAKRGGTLRVDVKVVWLDEPDPNG
ncbi:hypothetical protein [Yinghuangia sp. YIM S09857]|uniref:hypothetical protein n=1 Tax=Yinghuangia sp. YIM S09857 TaxID=3436929 RepID=UPI003F533D8A